VIRFFASHSTAANLLMIVILLAGALSIRGLERETLPEYRLGEVEVTVIYPGASTADIEESICLKLENAIEEIPGLDEWQCDAREGKALMVASILSGSDFQRFINDIKTEVESISDLPELVESIKIREKDRTDGVVSVAVSAPMEFSDLKLYAEQIKDQLLDLSAVNIVNMIGVSKPLIKVEIDKFKANTLGFSVLQIANLIREQNLDFPTGIVRTNSQEILLRIAEKRSTPEQMTAIVIRSSKLGNLVTLGDIAKISYDFEMSENQIFFDDRPAIVLKVEKSKNDDALTIYEQVKSFVDQHNRQSIPQIQLTITQDMSSIVKDRLEMLKVNGLQGIVLVFAVLFLFFGLKLSFWVCMGLPVSFMGGIFLMKLFGMSLNMLSLVGLLMAIGLLMDDAIVISENIAAHYHRHKDALRAAIEGSKEVLPGVISSFLTTLGVFGALGFLDGNLGRTFKVMPIVLLLVMSVSLIEAFWILPRHLVHSFDGVPSKGLRRWFENKFSVVQNIILPGLLKSCIQNRYLFLGIVFGGFLVSFGMVAGGRLKTSALPEMDGNVVQAKLLLAAGSPIAKTKRIANHILEKLHEANLYFTPSQPQKQNLVQHTTVHFSLNTDANEIGGHLATITADLLAAEERTTTLDEFIIKWREAMDPMAGMVSLSFKEPTLGPAGQPIHIRISGNNFKQLQQASILLKSELSSYVGVSDISDDLRPGKTEFVLRLKPLGHRLGITTRRISEQLRAAFQGIDTGDIYIDEETYEVRVKLSEQNQTDLSVLDEFEVLSANNAKIPLDNIVAMTQEQSWSRINRFNRHRSVTILAEADTRKVNIMEALGEVEKKVFPLILKQSPSLNFEFRGQRYRVSETAPSMQRALLLGVLVIFLILSYQFGSWSEPLLVMIAIPLSLIGVIFGHLLMGMDLSMPSMVGFISLAGIVVNDSILLIQFIKSRIPDFDSLQDAAIEAARLRFKPIFITSVTTIAGMFPLLLERSLQAQILQPLVISVVFGLSVTTLLILFVIPCVYAIREDLLKGRLAPNNDSYC
jgi:hydrophobic/amphiphilic exporter-1 (mainly G- bacteria), HAE1 family